MEQVLKSGDAKYFPPGIYKNIFNEVKKSCLEVDILVDEQLVSVIIKLLSLDPSHGLHLDGKLDRRSLGSFINKCVDIFSVEQVIQSGFTTTRSQLNISINELRSRLNLVSTVLSNCITVIDNEIKIDAQFNSMDQVIFSKLVKISILFYQHEVYVTSLSKSLSEAKSVIDTNLKAFRDRLQQIHELVKFRTAIPTDKIFPEFTILAQHWLRLQDLILLLSEINVVNEELMKFSDNIYPWEDTAYVLLGDSPIESNAKRTNKFEHFKIDFFAEVSVHKYSNDMKIENRGLCTWCLVVGRGLLLPATFSIGVCQYKNKMYGFINRWAAEEFKTNPEKFLFSIKEITRSNPELIHFLDKFDDLKSHRNELHYVGNRTCMSSITSKEVETQTDTHPVPSNVDKNYNWNIWELRRKAVSLSYLMRCETNSTQTKISYGNFDANTQTFSSKSGVTQTRCNGSTDTPKPTTLHSFIRDIDFGVSEEMQCSDLPGALEEIPAVRLPDEKTLSDNLPITEEILSENSIEVEELNVSFESM